MFIALVLAGLGLAGLARAQAPTEPAPKPLWEVGAFGGTAVLPDYPASEQSRLRFFAAPSFRYRGEVVRVDEQDNARARVTESEDFGFDISASGSFPASSKNNRARAGMPSLDWIGELGPRVYYRVVESGKMRFRVRLPLRGVFSSNLRNLRFRGLVLAPGVFFEWRELAGSRFALMGVAYATFASQELHRYFYAVDSAFATNERPAYRARAGYVGTSTLAALLYERDRYVVFTGVLVGFHHGARNRASPLFRRATNVSGIIGLNWLFWHSSRPAYD